MSSSSSSPPSLSYSNGIKSLTLPDPPVVSNKYQRTSLCEISPNNNNIWVVRGFFPLGEGQKSGLTWEGLRQRVFDRIPLNNNNNSKNENEEKEKISKSVYLNPSGEYKSPNNDVIQKQESTAEELKEEEEKVLKLFLTIKNNNENNNNNNNNYVPFPLDTTMTIVRLTPEDKDGSAPLWIHSFIPWSSELENEILKLGTPRYLIAGSLQHWLFLPEWSKRFPDADVYVTEDALGESVAEKLSEHLPNNVSPKLLKEGHQIHSDLDQKLFRGAPLNMNEFVFYHEPSQSLIVDDAFYPGYREWDRPSWFGRLWFKMTKGSFRAPSLPIYRTARVGTHGDPEQVVQSVDQIIKEWDFSQIVAAHGTSPFRDKPKECFRKAWYVVKK